MPAELTDDAVKSTRLLAAQGVDPSRIARDFDFDVEALHDAIEGVTHRYITNPPGVKCKASDIGRAFGARLPGVKLDGRRLRNIRAGRLKLSQSQFATEIWEAGRVLEVPNRCTKRLVQKWEAGAHAMPSADYQLALAYVLGESVDLIYQRVLPAVVDETLEQLAAALPMVAETYDKLVELNAHFVDRSGRG
jgi:transcriptional regulator with XRE-family HTH domain